MRESVANSPGFNRKLRKRQRRVKKTFVIWFLALIILGLFWVLFFSQLFSITGVSLIGFNGVSKEEAAVKVDSYLESQSLKFFPGFIINGIKNVGFLRPVYSHLNKKNYILLSKVGLEHFLEQSYPILNQVKINLNYFSRVLTVSVFERNTSLIWCRLDNKSCFFLDANGIAFQEATEIADSVTTKVLDINNSDITLNQTLMSKASIDFLDKLLNELKGLNLEITSLEAPGPSPSYFKVYTKDNWYILVSFSTEPTQIVKILKLLLAKELKNNVNSLEYIDLRYPERAIYKTK